MQEGLQDWWFFFLTYPTSPVDGVRKDLTRSSSPFLPLGRDAFVYIEEMTGFAGLDHGIRRVYWRELFLELVPYLVVQRLPHSRLEYLVSYS